MGKAALFNQEQALERASADTCQQPVLAAAEERALLSSEVGTWAAHRSTTPFILTDNRDVKVHLDRTVCGVAFTSISLHNLHNHPVL